MIVNSWPLSFLKRFGGSLPTDYCSWDLETTGFRKDDLIVEVGHCIVHDRAATHRMTAVLDWTRHKQIELKWLKERLDWAKKTMENDKDGNPTGKHYTMTLDRMRTEGQNPEEVLDFYYNLFCKLRQNGKFWLGQNLLAFDERVFNRHLQEFVGFEWQFGDDEVFDVGALYKATHMGLLPYTKDTLRSYISRVSHTSSKKGFKWNIESCMAHYGLAEKYAEQLAGGICHTAGHDSYICHLIFEEQRLLVRQA